MLIPTNPATVAADRCADRGLHGTASGGHLRDRAASGRRRGRQHGQDPARDRRDGRHLPVQLRLAVPGAAADPDASPTCPDLAAAANIADVFKPVVTADGKIYGVPYEAAMGGGIFYNTKIYEELGLVGPEDLGRVHGQQREDQGGRQGADRADLPRHLDLAALRAGRLLQRAGRGADLRRRLHRQQGEVRDDPGGGARLPAPRGRLQGRLLQRGLRRRDLRRRAPHGRDRRGGALPDADLRDRRRSSRTTPTT